MKKQRIAERGRAGWSWSWGSWLLLAALMSGDRTFGEDPPKPVGEPARSVTGPVGEGLIPLNKEKTVLLDRMNKKLLVHGHIAQQRMALELFACKKQLKEHESVVAIDAQAFVVHTGLVGGLGLVPGTPVKFEPEFQAPRGPKIDVYVNWTDAKGTKQRFRAQSLVRRLTERFFTVKMKKLPAGVVLPEKAKLRFDDVLEELIWYGHMTVKERDQCLAHSADKAFQAAIKAMFDESQYREMEGDFVFTGSGFNIDPEDKKEYYKAEQGDVISVVNFASAMIDVALRSSDDNNNLLFETYTERLPPRGTPIVLELIPIPETKGPKKP